MECSECKYFLEVSRENGFCDIHKTYFFRNHVACRDFSPRLEERVRKVRTLENERLIKSQLSSMERDFYNVELMTGDSLELEIKSIGNLEVKIFFKNKEQYSKDFDGNIAQILSFQSPYDGWYHVSFEAKNVSEYSILPKIKRTRREGEEVIKVERSFKISDFFILLPLFVLPGVASYLLLGIFSVLFMIPLMTAFFYFYEVLNKGFYLNLLYLVQVISFFAIMFEMTRMYIDDKLFLALLWIFGMIGTLFFYLLHLIFKRYLGGED